MSESQVIALRFRPQTFDRVVGQEAITRTLKNALQNNTLHHAYLFAGARGVGKTTTARIVAKALNCEKGPTTDPCGVCLSCLDIASSNSTFVREIDAASNTGIDNVREVIITSAAFAAPPGKYKIFIIDEVHQLSNQAFNALLKTIEEPPPRVIFIMATTEIQKVPETILSRCQIFEFRTIPLSKIVGELRRIAGEIGVTVSDASLLTIARAGEGSMRDSESAFDQVISFAGKNISDEDVSNALGLVSVETLNETMRTIAVQDGAGTLRIINDVVSRGYDLRNFCRDLMAHIRALLTVKIAGFDPELVQLPQAEGRALTDLANQFSEQDLVRFFSILTKTEQDIRVSPQPRFQLEIGLVKLAHAGRISSIEDTLARLMDIQSRLGGSGEPRVPVKLPTERSALTSGPSSGAFRGTSPGPVSSAPVPEQTPVSRPAPSARTEAPVKAQSAPASQLASTASATPARTTSPAREPEYLDVPPEPPMPVEDLYEPEHESLDQVPVATGDVMQKLKAVLTKHKRLMTVGALDHADSIRIDGEFLRISYAPSQTSFKQQIEDKLKKAQIEEAAREAFGKKLTISVTTGAEHAAAPAKRDTAPQTSDTKAEPSTNNPRHEDHHAVKAIVDKFHGEVIEVRKTDR